MILTKLLLILTFTIKSLYIIEHQEDTNKSVVAVVVVVVVVVIPLQLFYMFNCQADRRQIAAIGRRWL